LLTTNQKAWKILKNISTDPENRHGLNLKKYLTLFLKKGHNISDNIFDKLTLDLVNDRLDKPADIYTGGCAFLYDAHFYFILSYSCNDYKTGVCLLGFKIVGNKLLVVQIQGLRFTGAFYGRIRFGKDEDAIKRTVKTLLSSLKWERLLIKITEDWAREMGFGKMGILQARHNEYFISEPTTENWIARNKRLKMHYDVTAERMGYRKKLFSKYRFKNLPKT